MIPLAAVTYPRTDSAEMLSGMQPVSWFLLRPKYLDQKQTATSTSSHTHIFIAYVDLITVDAGRLLHQNTHKYTITLAIPCSSHIALQTPYEYTM